MITSWLVEDPVVGAPAAVPPLESSPPSPSGQLLAEFYSPKLADEQTQLGNAIATVKLAQRFLK